MCPPIRFDPDESELLDGGLQSSISLVVVRRSNVTNLEAP